MWCNQLKKKKKKYFHMLVPHGFSITFSCIGFQNHSYHFQEKFQFYDFKNVIWYNQTEYIFLEF